MMLQSDIIKLAQECGANVAEMRGVVVDVFFEPRNLAEFVSRIKSTPQTKPLSDEEIMEIVADKYGKGHGRYIDTKLFFVEFARAIEERHGIK